MAPKFLCAILFEFSYLLGFDVLVIMTETLKAIFVWLFFPGRPPPPVFFPRHVFLMGARYHNI
jgi:hypothetical protein